MTTAAIPLICDVNLQARPATAPEQGLTPRRAEVSVLRFVINPEDTAIELVSGIGILSYEDHHHGSTADTSVDLLEFHPAPIAATAAGSAQ